MGGPTRLYMYEYICVYLYRCVYIYNLYIYINICIDGQESFACFVLYSSPFSPLSLESLFRVRVENTKTVE
jgi:hypothetical protein